MYASPTPVVNEVTEKYSVLPETTSVQSSGSVPTMPVFWIKQFAGFLNVLSLS
jgi:hypothetical protein